MLLSILTTSQCLRPSASANSATGRATSPLELGTSQSENCGRMLLAPPMKDLSFMLFGSKR